MRGSTGRGGPLPEISRLNMINTTGRAQRCAYKNNKQGWSNIFCLLNHHLCTLINQAKTGLSRLACQTYLLGRRRLQRPGGGGWLDRVGRGGGGVA
jgi:hypothetical protein